MLAHHRCRGSMAWTSKRRSLLVGMTRDPRPLSLQVKDEVLEMLEREGYQAGDRIPSEQELAERLQVSRPTLREALKMLEEERVLYCQHGR
ncbi:MAG TPA: GntR family transcriptional regulator, partial [Anaerolineae bacterium]|nr:GntR family transcriptional regulator [Anaerolineae bacterium]